MLFVLNVQYKIFNLIESNLTIPLNTSLLNRVRSLRDIFKKSKCSNPESEPSSICDNPLLLRSRRNKDSPNVKKAPLEREPKKSIYDFFIYEFFANFLFTHLI